MAMLRSAPPLHFIQDSGVDTGDILSIARIPLNTRQSYLLNVLNLYTAGCDQLASAVRQLDLVLHSSPSLSRVSLITIHSPQIRTGSIFCSGPSII